MNVRELKKALSSMPEDLPVIMDFPELREGEAEPGEGHVDLEGYTDLLGICIEHIDRGGQCIQVAGPVFGLEEDRASQSSANLTRT